MHSPNHNEAGMIAFALAAAMLERLVAMGLFTEADELAVILAAADSFRGDPRINARSAENFLKTAALQKPAAK